MQTTIDDDIWAAGWLDRVYSGAPDECGPCFRIGFIKKAKDCIHHNK